MLTLIQFVVVDRSWLNWAICDLRNNFSRYNAFIFLLGSWASSFACLVDRDSLFYLLWLVLFGLAGLIGLARLAGLAIFVGLAHLVRLVSLVFLVSLVCWASFLASLVRLVRLICVVAACF